MVVSLEIVGEDQDSLEARGVTFYHICIRDSGRQWDVKRRYSDFCSLDRRLRYSRELHTLKLPSKGLMGFRRWLNLCKFNERRRAGLGLYLHHLSQQMEYLDQNSLLLEFLEGRSPGSARQAARAPVGERHTTQLKLAVPLAALPIVPGAGEVQPRLHRCCLCDRSRRVQESKRSLDFLDDEDWLRFESSQPLLAASIRRCSELRTGNAFENDSEAAFGALRRHLLFALRPNRGSGDTGCSPRLDLGEVPGKEFIWEFILLVRVRRPFYRNQVDELAQILETSASWAQLLSEDEELRLLKEECG